MTRTALAASLFLTAASGLSQEVALKPSNFVEVKFDGVPTTQYSFQKGILSANVQSSSSFLLKSFDNIQPIKTIQIEWTFSGKLKVRDASHEKEKSGDDSKLRIALLLSGKAPAIPFFAPAWITKTKDHLKYPSDKLLYLTFGALHKPGSSWKSPYSSSIKSIAVLSKPSPDGWFDTNFSFETTQKVVGFWILADGDNTQSQFTTKVRKLRFLP